MFIGVPVKTYNFRKEILGNIQNIQLFALEESSGTSQKQWTPADRK